MSLQESTPIQAPSGWGYKPGAYLSFTQKLTGPSAELPYIKGWAQMPKQDLIREVAAVVSAQPEGSVTLAMIQRSYGLSKRQAGNLVRNLKGDTHGQD